MFPGLAGTPAEVLHMSRMLEKRKGENIMPRAKAAPNKKITPAALFKKLIEFAKAYQIDQEEDFREAARIYSEEATLIGKMRDQIEEEGLTIMRTMRNGGEEPVTHPLLSELPKHVDSANKCLANMGDMVTKRGAKTEKAVRALDAFRLHP